MGESTPSLLLPVQVAKEADATGIALPHTSCSSKCVREIVELLPSIQKLPATAPTTTPSSHHHYLRALRQAPALGRHVWQQQGSLHRARHRHHQIRHGFGDQSTSSPSSSTMAPVRCSTECQRQATNASVSGQEQSYLMELEALLQLK
jgi:hypothetical protein